MTDTKKADTHHKHGSKKSVSNRADKNNINRINLSATQSRAVKVLLRGACISWDLERLIHCRYAPDIIQNIRKKGLNITTELVSYPRSTDGKIVKVGRYSIADDSIKKAELAVAGVK